MNSVYLSLGDRAAWQSDVDECPDCQQLGGETLCPDHDLDDEAVALKYSGSGD